MTDTLHHLVVACAMTLIGIGLALMIVPWLGAYVLLVAPAAIAAVAAGIAVTARPHATGASPRGIPSAISVASSGPLAP